eukprot:TRINITY_DN10380_c0_g1_i1.p1 TRINITY_DN10380_c0_g1~~TRINITY_DN10380_c0_g1_i1.p1  ORF type:complete len:613 (+),score=38.16 TRINITY_DN10380_c0_g1_i1:54-1892(+)
MSSGKQPTLQKGSQEKTTSLLARCLYPFHVIQVKEFLKFTGAPLPHQELLSRNLLKKWREGNREEKTHMFTSFVSHQWCSQDTPDPRGIQLDALRRLLKSGFNVSDGMANFVDGTKSVTKAERKEVVNGWLWYDFFGIPQHAVGCANVCTSDFLAAVQSIVAYVQLSDIFIALTPAMSHENGTQLNFGSWSSRGWCAAELSFWALSWPIQRQRLIRVHSSTKATCQHISSLFGASVYKGDFTVEDDRAVVCELLRNMIRECSTELIAASSQRGSEACMLDAGLLLGALEHLCGPPPPTKDSETEGSETESGSSMLPLAAHRQYSEWLELVDWSKLDGLGWTPAHLHSICGDISRLKAYLDTAGTHALETKVKYVSFASDAFKGFKPLQLAAAAVVGDPVGCIRELLARRADIEDSSHFAAVVNCTTEGGDVVRELLRARADLYYRMAPFGDTALAWASRFCNYDVARELIDQKADVNERNFCGFTCLHLAADNDVDTPRVVTLLLQARADVNAVKTRSSSCSVRLFESVQRARHLGGSRSELVQHVTMVGSRGATALHLAAFAGNWRVCAALLSHGAAREARTRAGCTPASLARLCGHDESFQRAAESTVWV